MIRRIRDKQLRHRIFQASFRGIQKAIEEKAREHAVPVIYVNPENTSKLCPLHNAPINYSKWHRDVAATCNLFLGTYLGVGSSAPSLGGHLSVDGRLVPLASTATHDPIGMPKSLWARWKSLPQTQHAIVLNRVKR